MYRSTPHGEHVPVLLGEVMEVLSPGIGEVAFDGTLGFAGHAAELLEAVGPAGQLIATDFDADNIEAARPKLDPIGHPYHLVHGNFAGIQAIIAERGLSGVDLLLVDLGMSSMQVDDAERGFSYMRDGPLDMRMDRTRGRTAAELLQRLSEEELRVAFEEIGDEENAELIARAIVKQRSIAPIERTSELSKLIGEAMGVPVLREEGRRLRVKQKQWATHPAARTFQTLRILVNRELANLEHLLRVLPSVLNPGGRAAIISFHSGEDRQVKQSFKQGLALGHYAAIAEEPIRPGFDEQQNNPRSRSAKLRWARANQI